MAGRTAVVLFMLAVLAGFPSGLQGARKLTTTQMRENTIRINALEVERIDITEIISEEPKQGPEEQIVVMDERSLLFDFDKSNVKPQYYGILQNLKEYIEANDYEVTIVGHTDAKGTNEYNMKLGMRRAESVKAKLLEFGVPADRIVGVESRGEEEPVATNDTAEGRAQIRRIEFKLVRRN